MAEPIRQTLLAGGEWDMGTVITFPAERCSAGGGSADAQGDGGSVIILPVIRVERYGDKPSDGLEPSSRSPRGKRRKR
jgi:hypothetical protein